MNTFLRNTVSKLYNAVSAPVTATRDALAERLQIVRDTATLLFNRTIANMGYGQERLKDIVEKGAEEEEYEHWRKNPWLLRFFLDRSKTQEICMKALEAGLWQLKDVPDQYKSQ